MNIVHHRLYNQRLTKPAFKKPAEVVAWLGAVQAQDYAAAKWSLSLRMPPATDAMIEKSLDDGAILRTHVMRPTWHFVMPEDIRWMQTLTAPRVRALLGSYDRKLELTEAVLSRCYNTITGALEGNQYLTREELADQLEAEGIPARGQRLAHIVMHAELNALICSGPRRGKQFTYALLDERVPSAKTLNRDDSLAKLALMYFSSHGPAQLKDFAWWSGLSTKDSQTALKLVESQLETETIDDKTYWFPPQKRIAKPETPKAFLLSIYDEYIIAYKDRSAIADERYVEKLLQMGSALPNMITLDGRVAGTWKRELKKDRVIVKSGFLRDLSDDEHEALNAAVERYSAFLELPVELQVR